MGAFAAKIQIIGINPYVAPPEIKQAGKSRDPIPVRGHYNRNLLDEKPKGRSAVLRIKV